MPTNTIPESINKTNIDLSKINDKEAISKQKSNYVCNASTKLSKQLMSNFKKSSDTKTINLNQTQVKQNPKKDSSEADLLKVTEQIKAVEINHLNVNNDNVKQAETFFAAILPSSTLPFALQTLSKHQTFAQQNTSISINDGLLTGKPINKTGEILNFSLDAKAAEKVLNDSASTLKIIHPGAEEKINQMVKSVVDKLRND